MAKKSAVKSTTATVVVLKVALQRRKTIWRRIAIRDDQTLDDLHEAIFTAFDRDDEHMYSFYFPAAGAKGRNALRNAPEYAHPLIAEDEGSFAESGVGNAAKTRIGSLGLKPRRQFVYLFDYGDSWYHDLTVEKTSEPTDAGRYPRILESHGKSPPQYPDVDGIDGEMEDDE